MNALSWAVEAVSLVVLLYSLVTLVRINRGRRLRRSPVAAPVNVRARLSSGEVVPLELVYVTRGPDGRALWTPVPTTPRGSVPPDADLVASVWPAGTVVVVTYRRADDAGSMVRTIERAEVDG